jgi:hypothetical protein
MHTTLWTANREDDGESPERHDAIRAHRLFIASIASDLKVAVGDRASVDVDEHDQGATLSVVPREGRALSVWLVGARWIDIQIGESNCRFQLDNTVDGQSLARALLDAVRAGRAHEIRAPGRVAVSVELEDGSCHQTWAPSASGWWWLCLIPQPGWRRWGSRRNFPPF